MVVLYREVNPPSSPPQHFYVVQVHMSSRDHLPAGAPSAKKRWEEFNYQYTTY